MRERRRSTPTLRGGGHVVAGGRVRAAALHARGGRPFDAVRPELLRGEYLRRSRSRGIASELFHDPRTTDYHLHKIFTKLGMMSRAELLRVIAARAPGH